MHSTRIAIFVATSWELTAVRSAFFSGTKQHIDGQIVYIHTVDRREYWLIPTGMGLQNARQVAVRMLRGRSFHLMVSTGFACALTDARIGGLLVGQEVLYMSGREQVCSKAIEVPGAERDALLAIATRQVPSVPVGRFVSTDRIVARASEKTHFATCTQAIGLDMESWALAEEAQRAGVPFVIVRSVSDGVDEDLPLDFNLFLRPAGWLQGLKTVLFRPSCLLGIDRLRRQSAIAARTLTEFFQRYQESVGKESDMSICQSSLS